MQQEFPGKKGISLTEETWNRLLSQASQVQEALKSLDSPGSSVKSTTTNAPTETIGHKDTIPIEEVGRKRSNEDQEASNLTKKPKKESKAIKEQDLVDSDIDSEEEEELLQSNHPTASSAVKPNTNEEDDSSDDDDDDEHDIKDLDKDDEDDDAAAALEAAMMEDSDASEEE